MVTFSGQPTVPCSECGERTTSIGTKLCDRCWELNKRIVADPKLAQQLLDKVQDHTKQSTTHSCRWCAAPISNVDLRSCYECGEMYKLMRKRPPIAVKILLSIMSGEPIL
jgi:ribosomal protein L37E